MKIEYWVKNITEDDLLSKELELKILHGRPQNLCSLNPNLTHEILQKSEEGGFLRRCFDDQKLIKLPFAPAKPSYEAAKPKFVSAPMPSRVKTAVVMDPSHQDFEEELTIFENDLEAQRYNDGFVDVLADNGPVAEITPGEGGVSFDGKPFQSITIKPSEINEVPRKSGAVKTKVVNRRLGQTGDIVIEPDE